MTNEHFDLQAFLSTKAAAGMSWASATLGIGTFMGFVNTFIGVASACWLVIVIANYFTHTRRKNKMEIELLRQKIENHRRDRGLDKARTDCNNVG